MSIRGRRLLFAQAMDGLTFAAFYVFVGMSVHAERNPLVLALMTLGGIQLVLLVKVGIAARVGWKEGKPYQPSRWRFVRASYPALSVFMMALATASGVVGSGFNVAAIVDSVVR